ncbi:hypothetical protein SAMN05518672_103482 [Chitinophaga sp. CF118]|uniref:DcrB-related protein n=1 Tax=Chitinophaga sp. CF118 TaxID=1884367 RepID=UPI0008EF6514|nr:DcrB-related protein [Chitinophaga sp. CF118]SFD84587.1 hypothetical protein SAMN05518672_103482 [Chitinophaga sp. CF118]
MKHLCLLLTTGLFVLAACQNNTKSPKTEQEAFEQAAKSPGINAGAEKFTVTTPEGWQRLDTALNDVKATFLFAPASRDGFRSNINVVTESMRGASLDEYFEKNVAVMGQYMQNFSAGTKSEKEINGGKVKILEYSHSQNGLDMDVTMAVIPKNGIAYVITVTAPKGQRAKYQQQFEEVVKSFTIS